MHRCLLCYQSWSLFQYTKHWLFQAILIFLCFFCLLLFHTQTVVIDNPQVWFSLKNSDQVRHKEVHFNSTNSYFYKQFNVWRWYFQGSVCFCLSHCLSWLWHFISKISCYFLLCRITLRLRCNINNVTCSRYIFQGWLPAYFWSDEQTGQFISTLLKATFAIT